MGSTRQDDASSEPDAGGRGGFVRRGWSVLCAAWKDLLARERLDEVPAALQRAQVLAGIGWLGPARTPSGRKSPLARVRRHAGDELRALLDAAQRGPQAFELLEFGGHHHPPERTFGLWLAEAEAQAEATAAFIRHVAAALDEPPELDAAPERPLPGWGAEELFRRSARALDVAEALLRCGTPDPLIASALDQALLACWDGWLVAFGCPHRVDRDWASRHHEFVARRRWRPTRVEPPNFMRLADVPFELRNALLAGCPPQPQGASDAWLRRARRSHSEVAGCLDSLRADAASAREPLEPRYVTFYRPRSWMPLQVGDWLDLGYCSSVQVSSVDPCLGTSFTGRVGDEIVNLTQEHNRIRRVGAPVHCDLRDHFVPGQWVVGTNGLEARLIEVRCYFIVTRR
ncbi:MAG: hypothetical protein H6746_13985 [Deltaproteobacteria bacterium]|nr:hypothetical protein [Deltaproteobacteria bacterium]